MEGTITGLGTQLIHCKDEVPVTTQDTAHSPPAPGNQLIPR